MLPINAGQSLPDIAVQQYGTLEAIVALAVANGRSLTDELEAGDQLLKPVAATAPEIVAFYAVNQLKPATALTSADFDLVNNNDPCHLCGCFT